MYQVPKRNLIFAAYTALAMWYFWLQRAALSLPIGVMRSTLFKMDLLSFVGTVAAILLVARHQMRYSLRLVGALLLSLSFGVGLSAVILGYVAALEVALFIGALLILAPQSPAPARGYDGERELLEQLMAGEVPPYTQPVNLYNATQDYLNLIWLFGWFASLWQFIAFVQVENRHGYYYQTLLPEAPWVAGLFWLGSLLVIGGWFIRQKVEKPQIMIDDQQLTGRHNGHQVSVDWADVTAITPWEVKRYNDGQELIISLILVAVQNPDKYLGAKLAAKSGPERFIASKHLLIRPEDFQVDVPGTALVLFTNKLGMRTDVLLNYLLSLAEEFQKKYSSTMH